MYARFAGYFRQMRTVGIEEELLLVDAKTGRPRSVSARILERGGSHTTGPPDSSGGSLGHELQQQQIETDTPPHRHMADLDADVRAWRDTAIAEAREAGARVVAVGTSPMPVEPRLVRDARFERMAERFGLTTSEQLTCGCHVHVSVDSDEEAVGVLDRIRVWLPPILALSANSPFWQGIDTRYASFRTQVMNRWPTAGPNHVFGSAESYRRLIADMTSSGVLLDEGMVYFDVRLSHRYPTVEIRVADVCLHAEDTVFVAALCRGLVETASRSWQAGEPPPDVSTALLRLSVWQAAREGIEGNLLDPASSRPRSARQVVDVLVRHIWPALEEAGDHILVEERLTEIWSRGNGATRQRASLERTGQLSDVVADLAHVTAGQVGCRNVLSSRDLARCSSGHRRRVRCTP